MLKKLLILTLVMMLDGSILIQTVKGKEFPTKQIEIICPYTPGSSMDLVSRLVADIAPKYLGQPVVVVNKPGAAGSIAAADVISSKPDGYKLITMTSFFFAATVKTQKVPFDPDDLVPIANFVEYKFGMLVKGDSPWKTLGDLLDYGRKNPGKLRWTHPGRGISIHMSGVLIFRKAGVETVEVPYKGSPEMLAALLGGHVDAATITYGAVKDHVKTRKVRYLTVYSDRRYSDPSDVPCVVELGFPEAAIPTFVGLYAHKSTPEDIKKTLTDALKKTYEDPEFKKGIEKFGEEPRFGGPEFIKEAIKKGGEVGVPILKELGLYVGK
jgi:tripartite-type tricarboxylate transporter receptor subunit TctC